MDTGSAADGRSMLESIETRKFGESIFQGTVRKYICTRFFNKETRFISLRNLIVQFCLGDAEMKSVEGVQVQKFLFYLKTFLLVYVSCNEDYLKLFFS